MLFEERNIILLPSVLGEKTHIRSELYIRAGSSRDLSNDKCFRKLALLRTIAHD
jgi:hypothetical protein